MNSRDHWNLIASDPRLKSDSSRGYDFTPYVVRSNRWWLYGAGCFVLVSLVVAFAVWRG